MLIVYGLLLQKLLSSFYLKLFFVLLWGICIYLKSGLKQLGLWLFCFLIYSFSLYTPLPCVMEGTVTKISPKTIVIGNIIQKTEVRLVYDGALGDTVKVSGACKTLEPTPTQALQRIRHQMVAPSSVQTVHHHFLYYNIWENMKDYPLIKNLFFNQYHDDLGLLTSAALQVSGFLIVLESLLRWFLYEKTAKKIIRFFLVVNSVLMPSYSLIRLFLQTLRPWLRKEDELILMLCLFPGSERHLAFVFAYGMVLIQKLSYHLRNLKPFHLMPLLQLALVHRINLLELLGFRLLTVFAGLMYGLCFIPVLYPFITWCLQFYQGMMMSGVWQRFSIYGSLGIFGLSLSLYIYVKQGSKRYLVYLLLFGLSNVYAPFPKVVYIDVGQGDATLVVFPFNSYTILIDTGRNFAQYTLQQTLWKHHVGAIDTLILTHDDLDHVENQAYLEKHFYVKETVTQKQEAVLGLQSFLNEVEYEGSNENSLIFGVKLNGLSYLFTGDAPAYQEQELLKNYPKLQVDILKLGHHGSKTSTSTVFVGNIRPKLAIVSSNPRIYNHPHPEVMKRLYQHRIPVLETSKEGTITILMLPWLNVVLTETHHFGIID